jgi:biotin/methionine sulfoxide reductase
MIKTSLVATHWGNFMVDSDRGEILDVRGHRADESPSPMGRSLLAARDSKARIPRPMVRQGFLQHGRRSDGRRRGVDPFVAVPWDEALDLAADALAAIKAEFGNNSIFGGSYGWASAGRFHHAQSQTHRFLNLFGGYIAHRESYSTGAGEVILPHVLGISATTAINESVACEEMVGRTQLLVAFGGIAMKNAQVNAGGLGNHCAERQLRDLKGAGVQVVNISPARTDTPDYLDADWIPIRPTTDTALMLGLAHTLVVENLHDKPFIARHTVGFERLFGYLLGRSDGIVKDAAWAATVADVRVDTIKQLARAMAAKRTVISVSWSLQRAEHGEQPWWMAVVLASMLGYIGLPGGGISFGFGSEHSVGFTGRKRINFKIGHFPQGRNAVDAFIPVARIADALKDPGATIQYNGREVRYPDIRAVIWAGGNPFHHHQDLNKLMDAWARPQLVMVNEIYWTSLARRADIVFPVTSPMERDDLAGASTDHWLIPSRRAVEPYAEARDDYAVYAALAERLGFGLEFTEGRSAAEWIRHLYAATVASAGEQGVELPDFETFWNGDPICLADQIPAQASVLERFREDPESNPLPLTPSGKIEIFSDVLYNMGYNDCAGHPAWFAKREWLGAPLAQAYPLHLISNQPRTRLHSQLDHGSYSRESKVQGREVMWMHPSAARARHIEDGDIVRLFNGRGACLAAARLTEDLRADVVILPTGAWYDPIDASEAGSLDAHGNPNVLTQDVGTSQLGQACAAQSCLVEVEPYRGALPPITVFDQPAIVQR